MKTSNRYFIYIVLIIAFAFGTMFLVSTQFSIEQIKTSGIVYVSNKTQNKEIERCFNNKFKTTIVNYNNTLNSNFVFYKTVNNDKLTNTMNQFYSQCVMEFESNQKESLQIKGFFNQLNKL